MRCEEFMAKTGEKTWQQDRKDYISINICCSLKQQSWLVQQVKGWSYRLLQRLNVALVYNVKKDTVDEVSQDDGDPDK